MLNHRTLIARLKQEGIPMVGDFRLHSGAATTHYFNMKKLGGLPELRRDICDAMAFHIAQQSHTLTNIACDEGVGPLAGSIVQAYVFGDMKLTLIRSALKDHGDREGLIDYYVPRKGDVIGLFDDIVTQGESLVRVMDALTATGATIGAAYCFIQRDDVHGGHLNLSIPLYPLFKASEFL